MQFERGVGAGQKAGHERCLKGNQMHAGPLMDRSPIHVLPGEIVNEVNISYAR